MARARWVVGRGVIVTSVTYAHCCRWWPVAGFDPIGKCGLCGERPEVNRSFTHADYENWRNATGSADARD